MRSAASVILVLVLAAAARADPLDQALHDAVVDARALPPDARLRTRYLALYALPDKEREAFTRALAFHVNTLSREAELIAPRRVSPGLVAVVLDDYGWEAKTWEKLAEVDPYFHARVDVVEVVVEDVEYGNWWYGGRIVERGTPGAVWKTSRVEKVKKEKKVRKATASAPWLAPAAAAELILLTQSQAPLVRADWFLVQTAIARKDVGYYDFLALGKKEKDFQKLIAADPEAARRVRKEIAAVLARSGVALQNRRVVRFQSLTGAYYVTEDFKTSKEKQNVLRFLDGDTEPPRGDASEQYGTLPNGLFAFWLQDANGNRVDVVPPDIATDGTTGSNDRNIYAGKSCITCHVEGIRPVNDYARRLFRGAVTLQSADYEKFRRLRQLYLSDLEGQVKRDQDDYARVLLAVNNLTPAANARLYAQVWDAYVERDLSVADAARELGVTPERLVAAVKAYALAQQRAAGAFDPIVAELIAEPAIPIRREHYEEVYPLLQQILTGYRP